MKDYKKKYDFIKTEYDKTLIGKTFTNTRGYDFEVVCYGYQKKYVIYYQIRFPINNYIMFATKSCIVEGIAFNPYIEHKMNKFAYGIVNDQMINYKNLKDRWDNMIDRCYDKKQKGYSSSGGKGVKVDYRWHTFQYFVEDVVKFRTYHPALVKKGLVHLDKDYYQRTVKDIRTIRYSKETCQWLWAVFNMGFVKKTKPKVKLTSLRSGKIYYGYNAEDLWKKTKFKKKDFLEMVRNAKELPNKNFITKGNWKIESLENDFYKQQEINKRMEELGI